MDPGHCLEMTKVANEIHRSGQISVDDDEVRRRRIEFGAQFSDCAVGADLGKAGAAQGIDQQRPRRGVLFRDADADRSYRLLVVIDRHSRMPKGTPAATEPNRRTMPPAAIRMQLARSRPRKSSRS